MRYLFLLLSVLTFSGLAMGNAPKKNEYKVEILKMEVVPSATTAPAVQESKNIAH